MNKQLCPKCDAERTPGDLECQNCGVIYAKVDAAALKQAQKKNNHTPQDNPKATKTPETNNGKLQPCPSCEKEISPNAVSCPHCGEPLRDLKEEEKQLREEQNKKGCLSCMGTIALIIVIGWLFSPSTSTKVSASDYGASWPLTVPGGTLECSSGKAVTFTTYDGRVYGLNGPALNKYPAIDPIWKTDEQLKRNLIAGGANPNSFFPKKSIGRLTREGLSLCK